MSNKIQEVFGLDNIHGQGTVNSTDVHNFNKTGTNDLSPKYKVRPKTIEATSVDDYMFDEMLKKSPKLRQQIDEYKVDTFKYDENGNVVVDEDSGESVVEKGYEPFSDLAGDVFQTFYKHKPQFRDDKFLDSVGKNHKKMLESYMQSESYEKLHKKTKHDMVNSAIASQTAYNVLYEQIQMQMQQGNNPDPNGPPGGNGNNPSNQPGNSPDPSAMKRAMDKLNKDMDEMDSMINSYGLEDGTENRMSYKEKKELLEVMRKSKKFRSFSQLVGRYRLMAKQIFSAKERHLAPTIQSITTGDDIKSLIPAELMYYQSKKSRLLFYKKYLERQLMQYDRFEYTEAGRGPIVVAVDTSGSMSGESEKWSKAVALALLEMAQLQKRDFACLFFDSNLRKVVEIPSGFVKGKDVIDIAEYFSGGGTNFERPMAKAFEIIENSPKFKKADVVFITDGEAPFNNEQEMMKKKLALGTRVQTILIDEYGYGAEHCTLNNISDSVTNLQDFVEGSSFASNILEGTLSNDQDVIDQAHAHMQQAIANGAVAQQP